MIAREEIEFTLAMAEKGIRAQAPAEVMAELCRVYLAYLDAPEVPLEIVVAELCRVHGKTESLDMGSRVRLVAVQPSADEADS